MSATRMPNAVDYTPPAHTVHVCAAGRQVLVSVDSSTAFLTPDEAANLQAELTQAEGEARGNLLRSAP